MKVDEIKEIFKVTLLEYTSVFESIEYPVKFVMNYNIIK
jgi:hypothetical protein